MWIYNINIVCILFEYIICDYVYITTKRSCINTVFINVWPSKIPVNSNVLRTETLSYFLCLSSCKAMGDILKLVMDWNKEKKSSNFCFWLSTHDKGIIEACT